VQCDICTTVSFVTSNDFRPPLCINDEGREHMESLGTDRRRILKLILGK